MLLLLQTAQDIPVRLYMAIHGHEDIPVRLYMAIHGHVCLR